MKCARYIHGHINVGKVKSSLSFFKCDYVFDKGLISDPKSASEKANKMK